jgi:hypothetical protein
MVNQPNKETPPEENENVNPHRAEGNWMAEMLDETEKAKRSLDRVENCEDEHFKGIAVESGVDIRANELSIIRHR